MPVEIQTAGIAGLSGIEMVIAIAIAVWLFMGGPGHGHRKSRKD